MANKVFKYFIEAKEEMQKVTWPTQKETIRYTVLVVVMTILMGAYFGVADFAFQNGLQGLLSISGVETTGGSALPASDIPETTIDIGDIDIGTSGDVDIEVSEPETLEEVAADEEIVDDESEESNE